MISAVLESRLREAGWDAETARVNGDAEALLEAIQTADELRAEKARLADPAWVEALATEM